MNPSSILYSSILSSRQILTPLSPLMLIANEISTTVYKIPTVPSVSSVASLPFSLFSVIVVPSSSSSPAVFSSQRSPYFSVPRRNISTYRLYSQVTELRSRISGRVVPKGLRTVTKDLLEIRQRLENWDITDVRTLLVFLYATQKYSSSSTECTESRSTSFSSSKLDSLSISGAPSSYGNFKFPVDDDSRSFSLSSLFSTNISIPHSTIPNTDIDELIMLRKLLAWSHASYSESINEVKQMLQKNETVKDGKINVSHPPPTSSTSTSIPSSTSTTASIEILHASLQADADTLLPAFIVGIDHSLKSIIISIRGSYSWQDAMINFSVLPEPCSNSILNTQYMKENPHITTDEQLSTVFTAHRGMVLTAKNLIHTLESSLNLLSTQHLQRYPHYRIQLVGHSLGGGIASMMAILLQAHIPGIHAYSFSSPACMSAELAKASQGFITSIVNGDDVVSRFHVSSSELLREELRAINWTKEITERTGIDRLWSRLPTVLPNIEQHISTVSSTLSQASSQAVGTLQKIMQVTTPPVEENATEPNEGIGRMYKLRDRLRRHKYSGTAPSHQSSSTNHSSQDTAQVLSQAESALSSTVKSNLLKGVKNTLLQSINIIKPVLHINENVNIPVEFVNSTATATTTTTTTTTSATANINGSTNASVKGDSQSSILDFASSTPSNATPTPISLNKSMQYYIPGDIYWMYYPSNYTRIMEIQTIKTKQKRLEETKRSTANQTRHQRTTKLIHNMEDFHVDIDNISPKENESLKYDDNDDMEDNDDNDDMDNLLMNPLQVSRIAIDDMGTHHHQLLLSSGSTNASTTPIPYVGGILLKVPYTKSTNSTVPMSTYLNNKENIHQTTSDPNLLKELPHSLFATITMSKWIFMDHSATSLEYEWDHYVQWLQKTKTQTTE